MKDNNSIIAEEQAPITAIKYVNKHKLYTKIGRDKIYKISIQDMEQYAQAKVLEALEMEFSKVDILMFDEDRSSDYTEQGKFYYETEVKPKYE